MRRVLGVAVVLLLLSGCAGPRQSGFERALALYRKGASGEAVLRESAERDPDLQGVLAVMYQLGIGVPENYAESAKWYELAVRRGDPDLLLQLAEFYYVGSKDLAKDQERAVALYEKGAAQGDSRALLRLCTHLLRQAHGEGKPALLDCYRRLAAQGAGLGFQMLEHFGAPAQEKELAPLRVPRDDSRFQASRAAQKDMVARLRKVLAERGSGSPPRDGADAP